MGVKIEYKRNEPFHLKINSINDMEIIFTENEINIQNKVIVGGYFSELHFIGFTSVKQASWIVKKSKKK